jgi:hypothetical protein
VHYLSHRWADVTFDAVVAALDARHQSLPRSVRFDLPPSDEPGRRILVSTATGGIYRTIPNPKECGDHEL